MSDDSGSTLDPEKIPRRRGLHIRDIKEEAPEPEQTVGYELRTAREAAGKELNEVAATLRIKPEHLRALEEAEYGKLPAKAYVVGFVRQYAQQLGLDPNELVERLKVELEGPPAEEEAPAGARAETASRRGAAPVRTGGISARPAPPAGSESRLPITSIAIVVILLVLVIFGGWYLTRPSGDKEAAADKEPKTGLNSAPAAPGENTKGSGPSMPDPPVIPASAGKGAGSARGGSLTALLPGADRLPGADGAAGEPSKPLNLPDAAAMAVPIQNSRESAAAGDEAAGPDDGTGAQRAELVETAMPQPNLQLQTRRSNRAGLPAEPAKQEDSKPEQDEPALEEIEAEGVGGSVQSDEAPQPAPEARPRTEQASTGDSVVDGAAPVKSRVTLRVRSSTWVRVEDADGRLIMERNMRSGDSFRAPDTRGIYLLTKDAGAIELVLDGESIGRAGRPRQVLTGLLLSPDKLRQRVVQNAAGPEIR